MSSEELYPVNEETLEMLQKKLLEVNERLNEEIQILHKAETNKNVLFKLTSINYSLVNRTVELNNGFITLFSCKNYISAISLLRLQIENCLRLFGFTIMDDMPNCLEKFINGEEYKNLTGNNGNKLYDSYLAKEIDKKWPEHNFLETYKQYCEFVHFSGFYQNLNNHFEEKENGLSSILYLGGGNNMPHFTILNKINYTLSMFYSSVIIYKLFREYRKRMEEVLVNY
ncbi:hypothetical protein KIH23_10100 [Flavobacterium sp. CYK-55]|uniref:hypothetical protein n=1 Tax=Flavobacterium sp. CYK-55 TaxID=2835529 RepID=UPI001BCF4817|nr:hypothetical protein [Flavobacterium sp. CYK-55]MBS7787649.1 hypothetical protein [Flavobacterium sp. CYK-55]